LDDTHLDYTVAARILAQELVNDDAQALTLSFQVDLIVVP